VLTGSHEHLPVVQGYGCGDILAFTGDRHLHGTLPTTAGERVVVTFFFEVLTVDSMGRHCSDCHAWCERCEYSKTQWRKGDDLSSCKGCTGEATAAVLCPTCGETAELHHGGCCAGTDIGTFSGSHKGNDRPHARPLAVISFPAAGS
jgi:hypothetical protein